MPASSRTSRRTASSRVSPGSTKPARHENRAPARRRLRPSRARSPWMASMITTGSVRGKCDARQSGQRRFQPADAILVADPHWAQKRWRACQSSRERASARIAASPGGDGRGEGAHVDQLGVDVGGNVRPGRIDREVRAPVAEAEKDQRRAPVDLAAPLRNWLPIERRHRRAASERLQVAQRQEARLRVAEQRGDPLAVISALAGPIQRVAAEAVDVVHVGGYVGSTLTDRPVAEDRSIASISLWRWTARLKSTSNDPLPRRASAARA